MDDDVITVPGRTVVDVGGETEAAVSGWSTDTLHQHMQQQVDTLRALIDREVEVARTRNYESISNLEATVAAHVTVARRELDQRMAAFQQQMDDARLLLDERYNTSVKALDAAFASQQTAMRTALEAAEKAVQCVSVDTPVLCADLVWRPAGSLVVGDELVAFDENVPGTPRGRRFRRATVLGNIPRRDSLVTVTTNRGAVRCNRAHPLLARFRGERWRWVRAGDLSSGEQLLNIVDVWETDTSTQGQWLAGMYDGEGCLCFKNGTNGKARLNIVQRLSPTADEIDLALKARLDVVKSRVRLRSLINPRWSDVKDWDVNRRADIMKILGSLRPQRLMVNADQVWEDFPICGNDRTAIVVRVDDAGMGTVASLTTSTGTYIADGFCSHNTALQSAEKAVTKAEVAAEKRFEAVNEFRSQLADQAATFPSRIEVDTRLTALSDKLDASTSTLGEKVDAKTGANSLRLTELAARFDSLQGSIEGRRDGRDSSKQITTIVIAAVGLIVAIVVAGLTIYAATKT